MSLRFVNSLNNPFSASQFSQGAIEEAHERIADHIHRTPVMTSRWLNKRYGKKFFIKCENFQRGGAFKIRGAMNAVMSLSEEAAQAGVVTHSSGNHAQALAIAAAARGIRCTVVMPSNAPTVKKLATQGYGAEVVECAPNQEARHETTAKIVAETNATLVHPFEQPEIILGQATAAKELLEEHPNLNWIAAPIGGGGLMAGTCLAANYFSPKTRLIATEPAGADDAFRSSQTGQRILSHTPNTIADGLLTTVGDINWSIVYSLTQQFVTVSDQEIVQAMQFYWERMKLVVEPSGAVSLAAVLKQLDAGELSDCDEIGIIISGGNRPFVSDYET